MAAPRRRPEDLAAPRRSGRGLRLRVGSVALGVVALLLAVGTARAIHRNRQVAAELALLQERIGRFQAENRELSGTIGYLASDEFVAVEARRSLGLGAPGEQPVVVRQAESAAGGEAAAVAADVGPSLPQLWWRYFFGDPA